MTDTNNSIVNEWHLDKKVTLSLIFALFMQTIAFTWWASGIDSQVNQNARDLNELKETTQRVIVLETTLPGILEEIKLLRSDFKELIMENRNSGGK